MFLVHLDRLDIGTILNIYTASHQESAGLHLPIDSLYPLSQAVEEDGLIEKIGKTSVNLSDQPIELASWKITPHGRLTLDHNRKILIGLNRLVGEKDQNEDARQGALHGRRG